MAASKLTEVELAVERAAAGPEPRCCSSHWTAAPTSQPPRCITRSIAPPPPCFQMPVEELGTRDRKRTALGAPLRPVAPVTFGAPVR